MTFYFEGGLRSLVAFYNRTQKPVHKNIFHIDKEHTVGKGEVDAEAQQSQARNKSVYVEMALQYVDDINTKIVAFANNTYNSEGGTHVQGFKMALTRTINQYAKKNGIIKDSEDNLTGDDVLEGLVAVVSVKLPEIQFEGQTKAKLVQQKHKVLQLQYFQKHSVHSWKKTQMMQKLSLEKGCSLFVHEKLLRLQKI